MRFPTCQFYQSTFDVTRPCNFHEVLKTSVESLQYIYSIMSKNGGISGVVVEEIDVCHERFLDHSLTES